MREELGQDVHHELMLGGNPLLDAPIDVVERELRRVEPALARLRLFALGFLAPPAIKRILGLLSKPFLLAHVAHYRMPCRYYAYNYNANHGHWSIGVGGQRSLIQSKNFRSHHCFSRGQRSLIASR
jgi:hypothetical protein